MVCLILPSLALSRSGAKTAASIVVENELTRLAEIGDFTAAARRAARGRSGLLDIEEELQALTTLLDGGGLARLQARARDAFEKARKREATEAIEKLVKESRALEKKLVAQLRPARALLPEFERIAALAKRWGAEGGIDLAQYRFPISPIGNVAQLLRYARALHGPALEGD